MAADLNLTLNGTPVPVYLGENTAEAARQAVRAAGFADAAAASEAGALAAAATAVANAQLSELAALTAPGVYPDTATGLAAVAEGETFWVKSDDGLVLYRKVSGNAEMVDVIGTTVNVLKYGADDTGTSSSALAIQLATDYVFGRGGGFVFLPPGTFTLEGVELRPGVYYRGLSQSATHLQLPASPTQSMFVVDPTGSFDVGGFFDLHLDGGQDKDTALYDGIDFSDADALISYHIERCYIEKFRRGFNGSLGDGAGNDRFAVIRHSSFWNNDVGIFSNEHAIVHTVECRANNVGLDGRLNDFFAFNSRFNFNRVGINRDGTLTNSQFVGCTVYKNVEKGARLGRDTTWLGGMVVGTNDSAQNGGYGDIGLDIMSNFVTVTGGVQFGQTAASGCCAGAFVVINVSGAPTGIGITDNTFHLLGAGVGIDCTDTSALTGSDISGNIVSSAGRTFMRAVQVGSSKISGNVIELTADLSAGEGVFEYDAVAPHHFSDNLIFSQSAMATGHALVGSMPASIIADNLCRNFSAGAFSITNSSTTRFRNNVGYQTENSGDATIPSGSTSVTVPHGLARQPSRRDFYVTPTNGMGNATKYWVSGASATELTISVDQDPGGSGATFGWQVRIY
jgi:hypothetical protein